MLDLHRPGALTLVWPLAMVALLTGCQGGASSGVVPAPSPSGSTTASLGATASATPRAGKAGKARRAKRQGDRKAQPAVPAAPSPACPADMALVEGQHCRSVEQRCLAYVTASDGGEDKNRCKRFAEPTVCTSNDAPRAMRFCMDRYEYPNVVGELPITLVSWTEAAAACKARGKRLCTESEFTFACEGEKMLPYAVGFERRPEACNIDKPHRTPRKPLLPWDRCQAAEWCQRAFSRVDRRQPAGAMTDCVSPFGIYDLNGNVNEWVTQPWKQAPHRAALKGGWWGPVRNRCRAITSAHDEDYTAFEVGFRCCTEASAPDKPGAADAKLAAATP